MFDVRTTLSLDDDVLEAAKELANLQRRTIGEVISELARRSLTVAGPGRKVRNGVPLLPKRAGVQVTSELVRRLDEELP
jgi:hypothetical protein